MRTLVLLGLAAVTVVWADPVHANDDSRVYRTAPGERIVIRSADDGQATPQDVRVYVNRDDRALTEAEYRERWDGRWNGEWTPDGRVWNGTYQGSYYPDRPAIADDRGSYRDYEIERRYDDRRVERWNDVEMERVCGRRDTATGAIIGGLLGGVAGNRIAGRGNRTEGTIIGGVVGAAAGAAVGSAADRERCDRWWESSDGYDHRPSAHGPRHPQGHGYPAAYPGYGYYYPAYYYPAPTVTTVIIEGGGCGCQQVTETVTTTEYETVYTAPAKRVRRYAAPAPTKRVATKGKRVYRK